MRALKKTRNKYDSLVLLIALQSPVDHYGAQAEVRFKNKNTEISFLLIMTFPMPSLFYLQRLSTLCNCWCQPRVCRSSFSPPSTPITKTTRSQCFLASTVLVGRHIPPIGACDPAASSISRNEPLQTLSSGWPCCFGLDCCRRKLVGGAKC